MSYYTYVLRKYEISDCKTFEDVKQKFPDTNPAYLRKILYLQGFGISDDGQLTITSKEKNASEILHQLKQVKSTSKKHKKYPQVNCTQCGQEFFLVFPNDPFCSKMCKRKFKESHVEHKKVKEKITENSLMNKECPECLSKKLVWIENHNEIMCSDCGFVASIKSLIMKDY